MDNGCILPNNIRNTILDLKTQIESELGVTVKERDISIHEIVAAFYEGRMIEAIGCSGSSFIQPISRIAFREHNINLGTSMDSHYVRHINKMVTDVMVQNDDHPMITCIDC